jgi:anti-sigma factor RsiW
MDKSEILTLAADIARDARARARHAEIEATVQEFERSDNRSLRSLARVYRMLQSPPNL